MSNSLQPHEQQHTRLPCPSPTPELAQTHVHWVGDAIQPSHPLVPFSFWFQSFLASELFQWVSSLLLWPNYWNFSFGISPLSEYSGLISFRIDWFELLVVQRTFLQHNSKVSVLWCSAFCMVQFSHLYVTTRKTIALTTWTFVGKVMSLLCNMLCLSLLPSKEVS